MEAQQEVNQHTALVLIWAQQDSEVSVNSHAVFSSRGMCFSSYLTSFSDNKHPDPVKNCDS
jgi:hypothetical protein